MNKITGLLLLIWLTISNAYSEVVVESTSCGDDMFRTQVEMNFSVTDFHKVYSEFSKMFETSDFDLTQPPAVDPKTKVLFESLQRSESEAERLKEAWLSRSYTMLERLDYSPKIGPRNNAQFLKWAKSPESALSFCTVYIQIYGKIKDDDVKALKKVLEGFANPPVLSVSLDSRGGSIDAGIEIGRIVRKHYGSTKISHNSYSRLLREVVKEDKAGNYDRARSLVEKFRNISVALGVPKDKINSSRYHANRRSVCYSACALIYAGGIARLPQLGDLGVHQHFFSDSLLQELTVEEGISQLRTATKKIERYFNDLDISQDFLQLALSTNADTMHILSKREHQVLLPHAVIEYANVIPKKRVAHIRTLLRTTNNAFLDASRKYGNDADFRQIIESVYKEASKHKEAIRWANFQDYDLTTGQYLQGL